MTNEITKRLLDVHLACRAIRSFTDGMDFAAYEADERTRSAVERKLEIIGEALNIASRADKTLAERLPDFRAVVALRNRVIHGYDTVDDEIVWDIVQSKIPTLESEVEALFAAMDGEEKHDPGA